MPTLTDGIAPRRAAFLELVSRHSGPADADAVVLTHLLPDRPAFLEALQSVVRIVTVIAIPYSIDQEALAVVRERYDVLTPSLLELENPKYMTELVVRAAADRPLLCMEIGGYFAGALSGIVESLGSRFLGVIEDTESGHRRYQALAEPTCPVVSVARTSLKGAEDALVGLSCLYSVERLLRGVGLILESKRALVLGYGRVGKGLAFGLQRRMCQTAVYDTDPVRSVAALADGFSIPDRANTLMASDIVFGATGTRSLAADDFALLRDGCILASCSSRDVEFDLGALRRDYALEASRPGVEVFARAGRHIQLFGGGTPINFRDGAVIGPLLLLTQGALIRGAIELSSGRWTAGVHDLSSESQKVVAEEWLRVFRDSESGYIDVLMSTNAN